MKKDEFDSLIAKLATCNRCTNLKCSNKSLINIFEDYDFCTNIPSIWTDWLNRLDKKIIIIGQDWGPYVDMQRLNKSLNADRSNWKDLIESEPSSTKNCWKTIFVNLPVVNIRLTMPI